MLIQISTVLDIQTISFRITPDNWNVSLLGETDKETTKNIPGHSTDQFGRDVWTADISIANGRVRNWPHGLTAAVSLYSECGVYQLKDNDGNYIEYTGRPPECLKITDPEDMSFNVTENGYIEGWKISIDILKEWNTSKAAISKGMHS